MFYSPYIFVMEISSVQGGDIKSVLMVEVYLFSRPLAFLMGGICLSSTAQSDVDALRYSTPGLSTTARSLGAGGAFGALFGEIMFAPGDLSRAEKEMVAGVAAAAQDCFY